MEERRGLTDDDPANPLRRNVDKRDIISSEPGRMKMSRVRRGEFESKNWGKMIS